jgi:uncharacterized protein
VTSPPPAPSTVSEPALQVRLVQGIDRIPAAAWDACAGPDDPFVSHAFLHALEASGSASGETGWLPLHLAVEEGGEVLAVAPAYVKNHSWGEYVFDHAWADAYERAGGHYYPKLQAAVPFTPVPGRRLLVRPGPRAGIARAALIQGLIATTAHVGASSAHVTFCTDDEAAAMEAEGYVRRTGLQYHWHNQGFGGFEDFLGTLKSGRRKTIRKERAAVRAAGVTTQTLTGGALEPAHLDAFYPFYRATVDGRWGGAYLSRRFFRELALTMPERVVLVVARRSGRMIAGALNLLGSDTLYGRVWGCDEEVPFLHFEACYYAAIDFAIERGLARVEAGAQGPHKLQRGYAPVPTHSAHHIADPGLRRAVAQFLVRERRHVAEQIEELREILPYRAESCPRT